MEPINQAISQALIDTQESIEILDIQDEEYRAQLRFLIKVTVDSITNKHTSRAYERYLGQFYRARLPLTRVGVLQYFAKLKLTVSPHRMALAALRKLAINAESYHFISPVDGRDIRLIMPPKHTPKQGRWLTIDAVHFLITVLASSNARDGALFALLLGCGLRRAEAAEVEWSSYREVDGRMALVDVIGKGLKPRTVPVPDWAASALARWQAELVEVIGFKEVALRGPIVRSTRKPLQALSSAAIPKIVETWSRAVDIPFTAHDLRRTLAKLMRRADVPIEQITLTLGHSSVVTTERYIGARLDVEKGEAGVDKVPWGV